MTVSNLATLGGCLAGLGLALIGYCIGRFDDFEEEETPQMGFFPRDADSEGSGGPAQRVPRVSRARRH